MSKTLNRRWECPRCGAGTLAPERARRDDVRTWCLPCSKKTGRLVRRVSPVVEERRAARREAQAARERKARLQAKLRRIKDPMERSRVSAEWFHKEAERALKKFESE